MGDQAALSGFGFAILKLSLYMCQRGVLSFFKERVKNLHTALYRKYRPKIFMDIIGQRYITQALKNQIANDKIGHAFLFTGTRGTGKTSCAKIFAKAINCLDSKAGEPCLECDICKGIENESIFDVTEMDAASNNSVEDVREVLEEVAYLPVMAKYRVYIIDEVHMLSTPAFNALLKTLEEPPAHVIFILATTEVHKVPATILSRCQRYDFSKLSLEEIGESLITIATKENVNLDLSAAKIIASLADGAMRDALSILETCIATQSNITSEVVSNIVGVSKDDEIFNFAQALMEYNSTLSLQLLLDLEKNSIDLKRLCEELITHFKNLLLANIEHTKAEMLNVSDEKFEKLKEQAKKQTQDFYSYSLAILMKTLEQLAAGQNAKIALDLAVFKICRINDEEIVIPTKTKTTKIEEVKEDIAKVKEEIKEEVISPPEEFTKWKEVINEIKKLSVPLHGFIADSKAWIYNGIVYIDGSEGLYVHLREYKDNAAVVKKAINTVTGLKYNIGGFRNIEHLFDIGDKNEKEQAQLQEIQNLNENGVQVNIKE